MKENIIIEKLNGHDKEGKIGKIQKKQGAVIVAGEPLFTIESGKGALVYKAPWSGMLLTLDIEEGDKVIKGQVVGVVEIDLSVKSGTSIEQKTYSFGISKPTKRLIDVDLLIIGGGPGGYVAAIRGAQSGLKVAIIEEDRLGGTCLNYGCIPTKAMASSVSVLSSIKKASEHGLTVADVKLDFPKLMDRKNDVVNQLVGGVEHLMQSHEIEYINGNAKVNDDGAIVVNTKRENLSFTYKNLILALGSVPSFLPIPGFDLPDILTSRELLSLHAVPKSITIIGGGVIGMEFAFIYRALGAEVNVIEYLPQIINILDVDVAEVIKESAADKGIKVFEGACAIAIKNTLDGSKLLDVQIGDEMFSICSEKVAMAVGRKANLESLNLEKLGVALNERKNGIQVNEFMQTNVETIYAIGDITNIIQLAHVASHQGFTAVDHICGLLNPMNYKHVPSAIFTSPEIGHVGLTEKEAKIVGLDILVGKFPFMANGKALTMGEPEGFVKIIADSKTRVILGGTIVGIHATDLMGVISNLVSQHTLMEDAMHVIYAHPTTAESIHEALLMLENKGIHFA